MGRTDATARAAAAPQIETAQAVKRLKRYLLPISFAIKILIAIDKITKIGTNNKVFVPRPEICSIVTLKPSNATPKRRIFLLENSIPGAQRSSLDKKLNAIPIRTNDSVVFTIYENDEDEIGQELNLKTGHYYYIDVTKPHSVTNNSDIDRYHLVVDCFMDSQLSAIL